MIDFWYLGSAAAEGIPALFCECDICQQAQRAGGRNLRLRSCALVDERVMIDFPPDMLHYKHRHDLNLAQVSHIVFTHSHIDHLAASELCYYFEWYSNRRDMASVLGLYGNEKVLGEIRQKFEFDMGKLPECVSLHKIEPFAKITVGDLAITPLPAKHDDREQCVIYLIEKGEDRVLYANDTTMLPEAAFEFLAGKRLNMVSLDCTAGRFPCPASHMGFPDNLVARDRLIAQGTADADTLFVSHHFSHNGRLNYDDFEALARGSGFISSYDGLRLNVGGC